MKDKLKAIWRILRAKSFFYVAKVENHYISNYDINGVQPKYGMPAKDRVDIMFTELHLMTAAVNKSINDINRNYRHPQFIGERDCVLCANFGTMRCPNSSVCWGTEERPYFKEKEL
ncbi:MAG: hypothetical protein NC548_63170 [Lachnospiraceae bacterium]|nr:hypothetical protein [Lachnospiraceae bacterium]